MLPSVLVSAGPEEGSHERYLAGHVTAIVSLRRAPLADAGPLGADMTDDRRSQGESLEEIAGFLSRVEAFETLSGDQLVRLAAAVTHRQVAAGDTMIVEGGPPTGSSACFATAPSTSCAGTA